jgi:hypothetical protein
MRWLYLLNLKHIVIMRKPTLYFWKKIDDTMAFDEEWPYVTLEANEPLYCEITEKPVLQLETSSGGGHGISSCKDSGRSFQEWVNLLTEAERVRKHYYG